MNIQFKRSIGLLSFAMLLFTYGIAQKNKPIEGGYYFKNKWAPNIAGVPIDLDNSDLKYSVLSADGDTVVIKNAKIRKIYTSDDVFIFADRKFQYKNANVVEHTYTFGAEHFSWDFKFLRSFKIPLELGVGVGLHINAFTFPTGSGHFFVNVTSFPTYIQAKYRLLGKKNNIYLKGAIGSANNINTFQVANVSNALFVKGGLGFQFASRNRFKHFVELSQNYSGASGEAQAWDDNVIGNVAFSNIKFYRFTITYGFQFGK